MAPLTAVAAPAAGDSCLTGSSSPCPATTTVEPVKERLKPVVGRIGHATVEDDGPVAAAFLHAICAKSEARLFPLSKTQDGGYKAPLVVRIDELAVRFRLSRAAISVELRILVHLAVFDFFSPFSCETVVVCRRTPVSTASSRA